MSSSDNVHAELNPGKEDGLPKVTESTDNTVLDSSKKREGDGSSSSGLSQKRVMDNNNQEDTQESTPKKGKYELGEIVPLEDTSKWTLQGELAEFFHRYCAKHIPEKDLNVAVNEKYPVPTNLRKTLRLDGHMEAFLKKSGKNANVDKDEDLRKISEKVVATMGPLSTVWSTLEKFRNEEIAVEDIDIDVMADQLQKSVVMLGQTLNTITYQRRLNVLSAVGDPKEARAMLRDEAVQKQLAESEEDVLLGKPFEKSAKAETDAAKGIVEYLNRNQKPKAPATSKKSLPPRKPQTPAPFRDGPSFPRGGKGHQDGYRTKPAFLPRRNQGHGSQGTCGPKPTETQHDLDVIESNCPEKRPPFNKRSLPRKGHSIAPSRAGEIIHRELESFDKRPRNTECSQGMGDPIIPNPTPGKTSRGNKDEPGGNEGNGRGDREHVGQGGNKGGYSQTGSVSEQRVRNPKIGRRFPTYHKSKETKPKCSLSPFQNGGTKGSKEPFTKRGLHVQVRHEGRLLLDTPEHKVSETGPVQMAGETLRISLPLLRSGSSPKDFHETNESPNFHFEKTQREASDLSGRSSHYGSESRGAINGSRHSPIPISATGSDSESEEVGVRSSIPLDLFGDSSGQPGDEILPTRKESEENSGPMPGKIDFTTDNPQGLVLSCRETTSNKPSHIPSAPSVEGSPTGLCSSSTPVPSLRFSAYNLSRGTGGIGLVGEELRPVEWVSSQFSCSRNDNFLGRCENRGMGGSMSGEVHGGSLVFPGEWIGHKHAGASGGGVSNSYLHKGQETEVYTSEDRQHYCAVISSQDGGYQKSRVNKGSKEDLVLPAQTSDNFDCGMDLNSFKCESRLRIEERQGLFRMEAVSQNVQTIVSKSGNSRHRPVCFPDISPTAEIHELEGGSVLPSGGCLPASVVKQFPLRIPPFLSHCQGTEPGGKAISGQDVDHNSPVAISALVSIDPLNGSGMPNSATPVTDDSIGPLGKPTSSGRKLLLGSSGLDSVRDTLEKEGVSKDACKLIVESRKSGTTKNYQYAWKKWVEWCNSRKIDPFSCPISQVLNFLAGLFGKGLAGRSIGTYRSAISAFHLPVDGIAVGSHPRVSSLMSGVSNLRPPVPKYAFTWDVEIILRFLKSWASNDSLSDKQLSLKMAMLLSLTAISRSSELQLLDLVFLSKFSNRYSFEIHGSMKHLKKNQRPKPIEFYVYTGDEDLCPVKVIDSYEKRSQTWRGDKGQISKLFLSYVKPHGPITSTSIARWIKSMLDMAGVDASIFQAHSVRGASSSKALTKGLSVKAIMDKGNWSRESTWQKFYHKEVLSPTQDFQCKVLEL